MNLCCGGYCAWNGSRTSSIQYWCESTQETHTLETLEYIQPQLKYSGLQCHDMNHLEISKRKSHQCCLHFRRSLKTKEFLLTHIQLHLPRRSIPKGFSSLESSFTLSLNPCELMVATRSTNRQMLSLTHILQKNHGCKRKCFVTKSFLYIFALYNSRLFRFLSLNSMCCFYVILQQDIMPILIIIK